MLLPSASASAPASSVSGPAMDGGVRSQVPASLLLHKEQPRESPLPRAKGCTSQSMRRGVGGGRVLPEGLLDTGYLYFFHLLMSCELKTNRNSEGGWKEGKAGEGLAQSEDKMGRMRPNPGAAEEHVHCCSRGPASSARTTSPPRPKEAGQAGVGCPGGQGSRGQAW